MRVFVVLSAAMLSLTLASEALAQDKVPTSKTDQIESWVFPDDKLLSAPNGGGEMIIKGPPKAVRTILTRPRTHFVPELLKTIETL